jgi:simple sugar transport system substrate-binding protein
MALSALVAVGLAAVVTGAQAQEIDAIAVLVPEQGTDYGWNQQGVDAAKAVGSAMGIEVISAEGLGYGDVRPTLRELAAEGADLMIAHASGYNSAAPEVANETKVAVAIVDDPGAATPGLVADYTVSGHQGAYLAGMLAAQLSRTGTLGIVVSGEPPSWNSQSAGFAMGARAANADVNLVYAVIGPAAYADAAGGKRVTEAVIAAGADIVFGQGDGSTFGMLQAVETVPATDGGKVLFIDVIGDKTEIDKGHLLSSVVWNLVPVYAAMIEDLKSGAFGDANYAIQLADDSVQLLRTAHISDEMWAGLMDARAGIVAGEIEVPDIYEAEDVRALMSSVDASE